MIVTLKVVAIQFSPPSDRGHDMNVCDSNINNGDTISNDPLNVCVDGGDNINGKNNYNNNNIDAILLRKIPYKSPCPISNCKKMIGMN
jgi:hypothetical protein